MCLFSHKVNPKISVGHALVVELLITFQLVFTIFATCDPKRNNLGGSTSLSIGLAVVIGHLFAVSIPRELALRPNTNEKQRADHGRFSAYISLLR